jgi:hypothetical protein
VKFTLGSAAFFSSTLVNNSEHVKGIIPLSAPSIREVPPLTAGYELESKLRTSHHAEDIRMSHKIEKMCRSLTCMICQNLHDIRVHSLSLHTVIIKRINLTSLPI